MVIKKASAHGEGFRIIANKNAQRMAKTPMIFPCYVQGG